MGSQIEDNKVVPLPTQVVQCRNFHAVNSEFFTSYGKSRSLMAMSCDNVTFDNCELDNPVIVPIG